MIYPIKIIIADDHRIIRDGLKMVFSDINKFQIVGEVANGNELITILDTCYCDIILLDLSMPELGGLDSLTAIKSKSNAKSLVLTIHDEPAYVLKAVQKGADGYVLKNADHEELIRAVETICQGQKYYSSVVANVVIDNFNKKYNEQKSQIQVTTREQEVLQLVADGLSNKLIADQLHISQRTVETHRTNLLRKFDVYNAVELVKMAREKGLLN